MLESDDFYLRQCYMMQIGFGPKSYKQSCVEERGRRIKISNIGGDKSFADDLNKQRGIVRSRVALLLRSSEIKPLL